MHRRTLFVVAGGVVAVLGTVAVVALTNTPQPPVTPDAPEPFLSGPLAKHVRKTGQTGFRVRVPFELALTPTDDPLVFEFHPGRPADRVPPTIRVVFEHPPGPLPAPVTVVGTVTGFEYDQVIRLSGVPGVVVISTAALVP